MNFRELEVLNSVAMWNVLFTVYLRSSEVKSSLQNFGDSCAPSLGLRIYYVLYEKV